MTKDPLATELNPDFALTYLHLSKISMQRIQQHVESGTVFKIDVADALDAYQWLDATLALDPRVAEAYALRSLLHETQNRPKAADRDWKRALVCGYKTVPSTPLLLPKSSRKRDWFDSEMKRSVRATFVEVDDVGVRLENSSGRQSRANILTLSPLDQVWLFEMSDQIPPFN
ncbi:hypothetical protein SH528x_000119 [Novipirellula sp. SH528]|uniref:hypothetical protein n=1 Tax=Novipirellula sp. SH528 TaxID=3454466 RepID=UPI003F9F8065